MKGQFILLVEDDEEDQQFFTTAIKKMYQQPAVKICTDGDQALDLLTTSPTLPAALFLDINLPGMSGLQLLRYIKAMPLLSGIPAVILSSSFTNKEVQVANDNGALAYIIKPDSLNELAKYVGQMMSSINLPPSL